MTVLELVLGIGLVVSSITFTLATLKQSSRQAPANPETQNEKARLEVQDERRRIVHAIETERGSKVLTLIHRREPWAKQGDPEYITIEDTEHILRDIHRTPKDRPLDIILHTPGGLALAAEMIAIALHEHPGKVNVFVPFYAMSGGTLLALAADECYMERFSVLGPLDPRLTECPLRLFVQYSKRKR